MFDEYTMKLNLTWVTMPCYSAHSLS